MTDFQAQKSVRIILRTLLIKNPKSNFKRRRGDQEVRPNLFWKMEKSKNHSENTLPENLKNSRTPLSPPSKIIKSFKFPRGGRARVSAQWLYGYSILVHEDPRSVSGRTNRVYIPPSLSFVDCQTYPSDIPTLCPIDLATKHIPFNDPCSF